MNHGFTRIENTRVICVHPRESVAEIDDPIPQEHDCYDGI